MVAMAPKPDDTNNNTTWQEEFLQMLPMIERQARRAFKQLDPEAQEDAVSDVVAHAMCAYRQLHERNELQRAFASALTRYAIARYRDGRRCGTSQCCRDVYSCQARRRAGFDLCSLGTPGGQVGAWRECLIENRVTPIPEQVAFRVDFPRWLNTQTPRYRCVAERLLRGHSTGEVAKQLKMSPGRVSQLRRAFADSWFQFINDQLSDAAESTDDK